MPDQHHRRVRGDVPKPVSWDAHLLQVLCVFIVAATLRFLGSLE